MWFAQPVTPQGEALSLHQAVHFSARNQLRSRLRAEQAQGSQIVTGRRKRQQVDRFCYSPQNTAHETNATWTHGFEAEWSRDLLIRLVQTINRSAAAAYHGCRQPTANFGKPVTVFLLSTLLVNIGSNHETDSPKWPPFGLVDL